MATKNKGMIDTSNPVHSMSNTDKGSLKIKKSSSNRQKSKKGAPGAAVLGPGTSNGILITPTGDAQINRA